ncbi:50S ribosomal protein L29 [Mycoplasma suis]|uniref:Large ribosomal subunit protein uL29 n=2 Tax=Mycoplasma suis TaxID=57372 RepID=F0QR44_MYCSL|nr:50S ribosomal protein L29 [Mycoplasma suis]ADX97964.1 50S ribosomal protein L29 [Mycoplasma suis str. Illinois]CBZ40460.1 Ribosomal protein L29 [Mycoplasma suis KI3806]
MLKELRETDTESLKSMLFKLKVKLLEYRFQLAQGALKNTSLIKLTKRTIAQILTILHERKERFSNQDFARFLKQAEEEKQEQIAKANKK